jgi:hypothetical protein
MTVARSLPTSDTEPDREAAALRAQILDLVGRYARVAHAKPPFDPGRSPVPVSGKVSGEPKSPASLSPQNSVSRTTGWKGRSRSFVFVKLSAKEGFAARGKQERRSAGLGLRLNRLLQSDGAPLLGPEHRQVDKALDAEPARKATLHRGSRQNGGHERKGQCHPDRALALALADGARG